MGAYSHVTRRAYVTGCAAQHANFPCKPAAALHHGLRFVHGLDFAGDGLSAAGHELP